MSVLEAQGGVLPGETGRKSHGPGVSLQLSLCGPAAEGEAQLLEMDFAMRTQAGVSYNHHHDGAQLARVSHF